MASIKINDLTKRFGSVTAVDSLSFEIQEGEIFGFLGPNGAGKTTTIKAVMGLIKPTGGSIELGGLEVQKNRRGATMDVGYLPEDIELYGNLTGRETLEFFADLREAPEERVDHLLDKVNLTEAADRKVGGYSKGMIQRLALAQALIAEPSILILDEPTAGLDPEGTAMVKDVVRDYTHEGRTVFFSSHILPNVQEVADRVGIITQGKLRALDSVDDLRDELEISAKLNLKLSEDIEKIRDSISRDKKVKEISGEGRKVTITCSPEDKRYVMNLIEEQGVKIVDFSTEEGSLEDIFLKYTREGVE